MFAKYICERRSEFSSCQPGPVAAGVPGGVKPVMPAGAPDVVMPLIVARSNGWPKMYWLKFSASRNCANSLSLTMWFHWILPRFDQWYHTFAFCWLRPPMYCRPVFLPATMHGTPLLLVPGLVMTPVPGVTTTPLHLSMPSIATPVSPLFHGSFWLPVCTRNWMSSLSVGRQCRLITPSRE